MAIKYVPRNSVNGEFMRKGEKKSSFMSEFLDYSQTDDHSLIEYKQIPVEEITPRFVNKYRQSRIEQLADSIVRTNSRLIHPIVVVRIGDLPANSEIIKAVREQGKTISDYNYIIVSGERRYRAWMLLREREAERIKNDVIKLNSFDTITANILTPKEALSEQAFYADANNQARHLSPAEAIWFIKDGLSEIETPEQKRAALVLMNGSQEGIDPDPVKAAKSFRADAYFKFLLDSELGVSDWNAASIRNMISVASKCSDKIADAILEGSYPIREARTLRRFTPKVQDTFLDLYLNDRKEYESRLKEYIARDEKKKSTAATASKKKYSDALKKLNAKKTKLANIAASGDAAAKKDEALALCDEFIKELEKLIANI